MNIRGHKYTKDKVLGQSSEKQERLQETRSKQRIWGRDLTEEVTGRRFMDDDSKIVLNNIDKLSQQIYLLFVILD